MFWLNKMQVFLLFTIYFTLFSYLINYLTLSYLDSNNFMDKDFEELKKICVRQELEVRQKKLIKLCKWKSNYSYPVLD